MGWAVVGGVGRTVMIINVVQPEALNSLDLIGLHEFESVFRKRMLKPWHLEPDFHADLEILRRNRLKPALLGLLKPSPEGFDHDELFIV